MPEHVSLRDTRRTGNRFNVRTISKTKHTLRGTFMESGAVRDAQQPTQDVYSIPYVSGSCIGETGRPLDVPIKEYA
jgi:hypothetical protein